MYILQVKLTSGEWRKIDQFEDEETANYKLEQLIEDYEPIEFRIITS